MTDCYVQSVKVRVLAPMFMGKPGCIRTLFAVISSTFTHTVSSKSVTDEVGRTGAGLSAERTEASRTTGWKTRGAYHIHA